MRWRFVGGGLLCGLAACSGGGAHPEPTGPGAPPEVGEALLEYGIHPSFHGWSSRSIVFADAMMRASEFFVLRDGALTQELAPLIALDEESPEPGAGWPDFGALGAGEGVGARLFGDMNGTLPDGRIEPYRVTWEGEGDCVLLGGAVTGEGRRGPGFAEFFCDPSADGGNGGVAWVCTRSDPGDPVRGVHVWLPGTADSHPLFFEPWVAKLAAMDRGRGPAAVRFLDWNRINSYGAQDQNGAFTFDLAGRIRPSSPSQGTRRGVCPEFQVALCNRLGSDLHFQVPHRAELDEAGWHAYVIDVLRRIRFGSPAVRGVNADRPFEGLAPELTVTLELSNELWNPSSPAHAWFEEQARAAGITVAERIAQELQDLWALADAVFSGPGAPRLRRFVGGFIGNPEFAASILAALPPGTRVDALGPAGYFAPPTAVVDDWLRGAVDGSCPRCPTPAEVVAAAVESISDLREALRAHRALADGFVNPDGTHPRLVLYEAGQSFTAGGAPWRAAAQAAQFLPDLYYAYVDALVPAFVDVGVDRVLWYSFMTEQAPATGPSVGFGIWNDMSQTITLPVLEPYLDEGAPKAAAVYRGPPRR